MSKRRFYYKTHNSQEAAVTHKDKIQARGGRVIMSSVPGTKKFKLKYWFEK